MSVPLFVCTKEKYVQIAEIRFLTYKEVIVAEITHRKEQKYRESCASGRKLQIDSPL